jgi:hypothetical protein
MFKRPTYGNLKLLVIPGFLYETVYLSPVDSCHKKIKIRMCRENNSDSERVMGLGK